MNKTYRIIDANINRASEGIRVIEDYLRFNLEDKKSSSEMRSLRHELRKLFKENAKDLLNSRDTLKDPGVKTSKESKLDNKSSMNDLLSANFKRAQEALRCLEENTKILGDYDKSKQIETIRFKVYEAEKNLQKILNKKIPTGLYGITADKFSNGKSNIQCVKEMLEAGIKIIQYREKYKSIKEKVIEAKEIKKLCEKHEACFIVNDNIEIAILTNADGIHIGQDDMNIEDARKILGPEKIIGLSTHSPEQAENALKAGADYIGVGPIYKTQTKDNVCDPVGLKYLEYVVKNIDLPFVAIGGIKEHNINEIIKRGASSICLVTEIVGSENIENTVINLNEKIKKYSGV